jgi:YidC/Oxa1 family membrane protein insertase
MQIFDTLFTVPLTNILIAFYQLLTFLHIPFAVGFAIILMTAFIRVLLYPLMAAQIKSAKKMQDVAPKLSDIKEKHKKDKAKQQQEMMKLYKTHNINPASGCIPVLVQFPVLIALYHSLTKVVSLNTPDAIAKVNDTLYFSFLHLDKAWDPTLFGISLAQSPSSLFTSMPLILLAPLLTAVLQFFLSKMMLPAVPVKAKKDDFQTAIQTQSMYIFPLMIGYFSYSLPFGLSLYWNTFTLFGILQQYRLVGFGGLTPWIEKLKRHGK